MLPNSAIPRTKQFGKKFAPVRMLAYRNGYVSEDVMMRGDCAVLFDTESEAQAAAERWAGGLDQENALREEEGL